MDIGKRNYDDDRRIKTEAGLFTVWFEMIFCGTVDMFSCDLNQ